MLKINRNGFASFSTLIAVIGLFAVAGLTVEMNEKLVRRRASELSKQYHSVLGFYGAETALYHVNRLEELNLLTSAPTDSSGRFLSALLPSYPHPVVADDSNPQSTRYSAAVTSPLAPLLSYYSQNADGLKGLPMGNSVDADHRCGEMWGRTDASTFRLCLSRTVPAPTCALYASETVISAGEKVQFTWSSANADSVEISPGTYPSPLMVNNPDPLTAAPPQILESAALFADQSFSMICRGAGGTGGGQVTVKVLNNPPSVDLKVNGSDLPVTVAANSTPTLSWTSTNATNCIIQPGNLSGTSNSGTSPAPIVANTSVTYTATCTGAGGLSASDEVTVSAGSGVSVSLKVNSLHERLKLPLKSKLAVTWTSTGATSCSLNGGGTVTSVGTAQAAPGKSVTASWKVPTSISISCTGTNGTATDEVMVETLFYTLPSQLSCDYTVKKGGTSAWGTFTGSGTSGSWCQRRSNSHKHSTGKVFFVVNSIRYYLGQDVPGDPLGPIYGELGFHQNPGNENVDNDLMTETLVDVRVPFGIALPYYSGSGSPAPYPWSGSSKPSWLTVSPFKIALHGDGDYGYWPMGVNDAPGSGHAAGNHCLNYSIDPHK